MIRNHGNGIMQIVDEHNRLINLSFHTKQPISRLIIADSSALRVDLSSIQFESHPMPQPMVHIAQTCTDVSIENLSYMLDWANWAQPDWACARNAAIIQGKNCGIRGWELSGIKHGIQLAGDGCYAIGRKNDTSPHSVISGFCGDAYRLTDSNQTLMGFEYQHSKKGAISPKGRPLNHNDGIQIFPAMIPVEQYQSNYLSNIHLSDGKGYNRQLDPSVDQYCQALIVSDGVLVDSCFENLVLHGDHQYGGAFTELHDSEFRDVHFLSTNPTEIKTQLRFGSGKSGYAESTGVRLKTVSADEIIINE